MLARIRKAIVAGAGAALAAFIAALVQSGTVNRDEVAKAIGLAVVAGVTVGGATFKVRNTGTVVGSDPTPGR